MLILHVLIYCLAIPPIWLIVQEHRARRSHDQIEPAAGELIELDLPWDWQIKDVSDPAIITKTYHA